MANEYAVNREDLAAVADAIREKGGSAAALSFPAGFTAAIAAISGGAQVACGTMTQFANNSVSFNPGFVATRFLMVWGNTATGTSTATLTGIAYNIDGSGSCQAFPVGGRTETATLQKNNGTVSVRTTSVFAYGKGYWIAVAE